METNQLHDLWWKLSCEERARRYIQKRNKPFLDPDEFVQETYLYAHKQWPRFDPEKCRGETLEDKFAVWFWWKMVGSRTILARRTYPGLSFNGRTSVRKRTDSVLELDDDTPAIQVEVERATWKLWYMAEFDIEVESVDEVAQFQSVVQNIIKTFMPCTNLSLRRIGVVLKYIVDFATEHKRKPSHEEIAAGTKLSYRQVVEAYEKVIRQVNNGLKVQASSGSVPLN